MIEEEEKKTVEIPECGRRLRRTREQMGLSVDDVASELRLSSFQIRALEDDDWSQLPGTTYARGYLKAYARLLGLDAEQMLAGASTEEIEISRTEPAVEPRTVDEDDSRSEPSSPRVRWGWVAGIVLICALVAAGWQLKGRLQWVPGLVQGEIASL
ncbi:MAG: helix-turn-helix domain-containing protein, partial [Arenicellales bacterium]